MRKLILLTVIACLIGNPNLLAQNNDRTNGKKVIRTIWLVYQSCRAEGGIYIKPDKYITQQGSNKILGQYFISFSEGNQYGKITLKFKDDKIISAILNYDGLNKTSVDLTWENKRLKKVKIQGFSYCDYSIIYDENGKITGFDRGLIGSRKIAVFNKMEFIGDKISKITTYANKSASSRKNKIDFITSFEYKDKDIIISTLKYDKGKLNSKIAAKKTTYRVIDNNHVYYKGNKYVGEVEITYKDSMIVNKKVKRNGEIEEENYYYIDNKLFKIEKLTTKEDGSFIEKRIDILFTLKDKPESIPNYEKKGGQYRFNSNGNLIYESDGNRFRKKINGTWTNWKNFQY